MTLTIDPTALRRHFPSLNQEVNGYPAAFFDGPGGTQTPNIVIDAMSHYLRQYNSNLGGAFLTSECTDRTVAEARQAIVDLINARRPEEIAFGQNMTSLTFAMSRAISRTWREGDEIIVTRLDHDANISPWLLAAEEKGVTVRWLDFNPQDCTLNIGRLGDMLNNRTRLVAVTLASNAVGTIVDVRRVAEMAHTVDALVYVDAVHNMPHNLVDVQKLDCDFLVASAYKFFGPHTGIMYGKYDLLEELVAYKVRPAPKMPPGKWETGTQSFESLAGVKAAVSYLENIDHMSASSEDDDHQPIASRRQHLENVMQAIKQYEEGLSRHFLRLAADIPGLKVYGITDLERLPERVPTFAVNLAGYEPRWVAEYLGQRGQFVWDGHYYAVAVMDHLGTLDRGGLVRIGFVHYNSIDEIDRLAAILYEMASRRKPSSN